jgi:hypothetical protein
MTRTIDNYLDRDPIFPMAASIASKILAEPYDVLTLVYNHYENQVKFQNVYKKIPNFTTGGMPPAFKSYEVRPPEKMMACGDHTFGSARPPPQHSAAGRRRQPPNPPLMLSKT